MAAAALAIALVLPVWHDGRVWPVTEPTFPGYPVAAMSPAPVPAPVSPVGASGGGYAGMGSGCASGPVHDLIISYGWNDAEALAIASRESGCNPSAKNASSSASGVFQLMSFWWDGSNAFGWVFDPFDAAANVYHSFLIWQYQGGSFYPAWGL